jgi:hypothetical protein
LRALAARHALHHGRRDMVGRAPWVNAGRASARLAGDGRPPPG